MIAVVESFHLTLEDWSRLVQITAIVVGAVAAYIKWFRGRLYEPRLEITVMGLLSGVTPSHLLTTVRAKNVGFSRVPIEQEGSGCRILSAMTMAPVAEMLGVEWTHEATFPVFEEHEWIESSETIEDQLLATLPEGRAATYRVEVWVASRGLTWKAASIVTLATP